MEDTNAHIIDAIKSTRLRWVDHVLRMDQTEQEENQGRDHWIVLKKIR